MLAEMTQLTSLWRAVVFYGTPSPEKPHPAVSRDCGSRTRPAIQKSPKKVSPLFCQQSCSMEREVSGSQSPHQRTQEPGAIFRTE